jgi:hypothetical protein
MPKAEPTNRTRICPILTTSPFARPTNFLGDIAHRAVVRAVDRIPDQAAFCRRPRKFRGEAD